MITMDNNDQEWLAECSDDEKYEVGPQNDWCLKPENLIGIIERLDCNKQCLELEWKCPGRRGPSPVPSDCHQLEHGLSLYSDSIRSEEKDNFDFMDEMSSPQIPVRRTGEATPKGSAKKKTASFNGALSTMLRHRRQEQQEINSKP